MPEPENTENNSSSSPKHNVPKTSSSIAPSSQSPIPSSPDSLENTTHRAESPQETGIETPTETKIETKSHVESENALPHSNHEDTLSPQTSEKEEKQGAEKPENDLDNVLLKRGHALLELLNYEVKYCDSLKTLFDVFYVPLVDEQAEKENHTRKYDPEQDESCILPAAVSQRILPKDIKTLQRFHSSIQQELHERFSAAGFADAAQDVVDASSTSNANTQGNYQPPPSVSPDVLIGFGESICIGDIFVQFAPFFKIYTTFVASFDSIRKEFRSAKSQHLSFKKFLQDKQQNDDRCQGTDLMSFLVKPVQNIPRYVLLLGGILESTPSNHPDHAALAKALDNMKESSTYQNTKIHEVDTYQRVRDLTRKLNLYDVISSHSRMVKSGSLEMRRKSITTSSIPVSVYLLTDIMIINHEGNSRLTKNRVITLHLEYCSLHSVQVLETELESVFEIRVQGDTSYFFIAQDNKEQSEWTQAIQETISQNNKATHVTEHSSIPSSSSSSSSSVSAATKAERRKSAEIRVSLSINRRKSADVSDLTTTTLMSYRKASTPRNSSGSSSTHRRSISSLKDLIFSNGSSSPKSSSSSSHNHNNNSNNNNNTHNDPFESHMSPDRDHIDLSPPSRPGDLRRQASIATVSDASHHHRHRRRRRSLTQRIKDKTRRSSWNIRRALFPRNRSLSQGSEGGDC